MEQTVLTITYYLRYPRFPHPSLLLTSILIYKARFVSPPPSQMSQILLCKMFLKGVPELSLKAIALSDNF